MYGNTKLVVVPTNIVYLWKNSNEEEMAVHSFEAFHRQNVIERKILFKEARFIWDKVIRFEKYFLQVLFSQYKVDWSHFQMRLPFKIKR